LGPTSFLQVGKVAGQDSRYNQTTHFACPGIHIFKDKKKTKDLAFDRNTLYRIAICKVRDEWGAILSSDIKLC